MSDPRKTTMTDPVRPPGESPGGGVPPVALAFRQHDHSRCSNRLIAEAEELAGDRLTPGRRRVLEILAEEHRPWRAYEILERLVARGFANQPPLVYRALDFLVEQGFAHRIDRLNAFMACTRPAEPHVPAVLICRNCQSVAEIRGAAILAAVEGAAAEAGFAVERMTVEASGLCPACRGPQG